MAEVAPPRRDQRLLGQGTTRRCALFLVLTVTLGVGLALRAVRVVVLSGQDLDLPEAPGSSHRGLVPLDTLRAAGAERGGLYGSVLLDNAELIALATGTLLLLSAAALHLRGPAVRRRGLERIGPDQLFLHDALLQLTRRAQVRQIPAFYRDPHRISTGAVAFGSAGRYGIALDNGLVALFEDTSTSGLRFTSGDGPRSPASGDTPGRVVPGDGPHSLPDDARDWCVWGESGQCLLERLHCSVRAFGACRSPDRRPGHGKAPVSAHDDAPWRDLHAPDHSNQNQNQAPDQAPDQAQRQDDGGLPALDDGRHDSGYDGLRADFGRWFQQTRDGAVFAAVVLHELAHLRSRDVELGGAVRSLWLAFLATTFLPYMALLAWLFCSGLLGARHAWAGQQWSPVGEAAMVAVLTALAYAAYTDVLRHRELCADLDAVDWGADPRAWSAVAAEQARGRRGPRWDPEHWHTEPGDSWLGLFTWVRKARPLHAATRPWHTHPGWWWRIRALTRPAHPTGPNGTWTQALVLTGTVTVLMHLLLNELAHAGGLARLTSALFYCGTVLCVSLGRPLVVHPSHPFRPRPRAFGAGSHGRIRRAAVLGGCVLLLMAFDPLGEILALG